MRTVTSLLSYPVKSMRGHPHTRMQVGPRGPLHDREWMVVGSDMRLVSQRDFPTLAQITPSITKYGLTLSCDALSPIVIPTELWEGGTVIQRHVHVHKDGIWGCIDQGDEVAGWLSEYLGTAVRLVRMPANVTRPSKRLAEGERAIMNFADGYPFLFTTEESLLRLNQNLAGVRVPMANFRPNVVVSGTKDPWEEDHWNEFAVSGIRFKGVKPCDRCVVITTNQRTGVRHKKEPLRTLTEIHKNEDGKPIFGVYANHFGEGSIRLNSPLMLIRFGPRPPA